MKKLIICLGALFAFTSISSALCYFNFTGCDYDSCGIGCTAYATSATTYACYTSMDQCCECARWTIYCNCEFGPGTGHGSNWYVFDPGYCNSSKGLCIGTEIEVTHH
jgi:hypothetical protein